ncbi:carbohydrate-binding protein [Algibacillus agarilyticus]|uniref:carbohydrate-binding protein n=1 Tax=Algibacillus agarilyticus TaxID=2234133 RepID=UPI000DD0D8F7|nr:carbohydrate-binding protein [Algibacillus agarilyticus]
MNKKTYKKTIMSHIKKSAIALALAGGCSFGALADYVHTDGKNIVDENGDALFLNGINLGNWLLWEGYLMMGDFNYRTHTQFYNSLIETFGSEAKAAEFEHQWRLNYVDDKAIADLKALGFNSVRVPFHFNLFWKNGQLSDHGFQYFDQLIESCRTHGLYVLLDMHAAPGYQNPGDHADNVNSNASQPRDTVEFWDGTENINIAKSVWRHIAARYKDEPVVWGYDLINEPVPQPGREMELLGSLIEMRDAIREVDTNHVIVAEGSWWSSDLTKIDWSDPLVQDATGVTSQWDDNLVYQLHHYGPASGTYGRENITNNLNIPLIIGEYGESDNGNLKDMTDWAKANLSGYYPWSFKKMSHDKTLWTIPPNAAYTELKTYINNGGTAAPELYDAMIEFAQVNILNGHASHEWHQGFYEAVSPLTIAPPPPPPAPTCDEDDVQILLPGKLEAEDYCANEGVLFEDTTDVGGGKNIGWLDAGDSAEYRVNITEAGQYDLVARIASANATGQFSVLINQQSVAEFSVPSTGDWQQWQSISQPVWLEAGPNTLEVVINGGGFNLNWLEVVNDFVVVDPCDNATATNLPAKIEAESFCNMAGLQTETTADVGGGENIGWIDSGDWAEYKIDVANLTDFVVNFRVASNANNGRVELLVDGNIVGGIDVSNTQGWQSWQSLALPLTLSAGEHNVRLNFIQGGFNLNWIEFVADHGPIDPPVDPSDNDLVSGNHYIFVNKLSGKAADVAGVSTHDGGNVHQWDLHQNANQIWQANLVEANVYTFVSLNSGKCLDADSGSDNVHQWSCSANDNQKWIVEPLSEGGFTVRTFVGNDVLTVESGSSDNGANLITTTGTSQSHQQWRFELAN